MRRHEKKLQATTDIRGVLSDSLAVDDSLAKTRRRLRTQSIPVVSA